MSLTCHVCGKELTAFTGHDCLGTAQGSNLPLLTLPPVHPTAQPSTYPDAAEHVVLREHLADCPPSLSIYPDAAERRRYALLRAAAVILSHPDENGEFPLPESAVKSAQNLLAIIERREQERANG